MTETTSQNTQDNKKDPPAAWYQKIGTVAQICSAIIAFVGFTGLMWQIHSNETNSRQASARQIYLEYTKAALEKPQYLEPDMDARRDEAANGRGADREDCGRLLDCHLAAVGPLAVAIDGDVV